VNGATLGARLRHVHHAHGAHSADRDGGVRPDAVRLDVVERQGCVDTDQVTRAEQSNRVEHARATDDVHSSSLLSGAPLAPRPVNSTMGDPSRTVR
jgi:hypothetical protein